MALNVTNSFDNAFLPSSNAETFIPDQLIAGDLKLVTSGDGTILHSALLARGTVLGQILLGAVTSAAKGGGNTGTGTCVPDALTPRLANCQLGVYSLVCTVAGANSATFRLSDPKGNVLGDYAFNGAGASFTTADQIKVAVTDAVTDFVVGDAFNITVAAGSGKYIVSVATATDGSQVPCAILADQADASAADWVGAALYLTGEFNAAKLTMDASWSEATLKPALRPFNIFLKDAVTASDPSNDQGAP